MAAFQAGQAVDIVMSRTRTAEPGTSRALVRAFLDRSQQAVQAITSGVVVQVPLDTVPRQLIYPIVTFATGQAEDAPLCCRVERVTTIYPPHDVPEVSWKTLVQTDRHWIRAVGSRLLCWARLGNDFIILYPALDEVVRLAINYARIPNRLASDAEVFDLREDRAEACLDLAEVLLLLRQRTPLAIEAAREHMNVVMARMTRVKGTGVVGFGEGGFGVQNVAP